MTRRTYKIIIVGGGICGLATTLALRGPNRDITVLEQSRMNKEVGALISLQPNASRIATKLGLDKFLSNKRPTIDQAFQIYNPEGQVVRTIKLDTASPASSRVIYHRVDLHDSLKEAATAEDGSSPPAKIQISSRVVACDPEAGSVTLENGQVWTADLIIGADGIHSVLRTYVLPESVDRSQYEPKRTGISAYRLLLPTSRILNGIPDITTCFDPTAAMTHMILGQDQRVVMGPARQGSIFGITALVPDENMHEPCLSSRSWTSRGSVNKLLESFSDFPTWLKAIFTLVRSTDDDDSVRNTGASGGGQGLSSVATDLALWQLRDIDPLPCWSTGRVILAGDAAHAMLPTQGQGASQSFEDAEALAEFLTDIQAEHESSASGGTWDDGLGLDEVNALADRYFRCRYDRASLIQAYSREQGMKSGTTGRGSERKVTLDPGQFMEYNTSYHGARDWEKKQQREPKSLNPAVSSGPMSSDSQKQIEVTG